MHDWWPLTSAQQLVADRITVVEFGDIELIEVRPAKPRKQPVEPVGLDDIWPPRPPIPTLTAYPGFRGTLAERTYFKDAEGRWINCVSGAEWDGVK